MNKFRCKKTFYDCDFSNRGKESWCPNSNWFMYFNDFFFILISVIFSILLTSNVIPNDIHFVCLYQISFWAKFITAVTPYPNFDDLSFIYVNFQT